MNQTYISDYDKVKEVGSTIGLEAEHFEDSLFAMERSLQKLKNSWKGEAANAFFSNTLDVFPTFYNHETSLNNIEIALDQIVANYQSVDNATVKDVNNLNATSSPQMYSKNPRDNIEEI